ncbi:MAG: DUF6519 domain-containing protein, partial [Mariprofundaceae bacterium]|nr:DUF6519 domain-containing protein [Mariprofundaceae bacterium]
MKTEISRDSHEPEKKYSGVYQQQGRMLTDADWNELMDIVKGRLDETLVDVLGSGSPRHRNVVNNDVDPPVLQWGDVYAEGVHAEVRPVGNAVSESDFEYDHQQSFPSAPALPASEYTLYADVWERTVTCLEDEGLIDSALHGADTCTRTQTMCQVKWSAGDDPEDQSINPGKGNALLSVTLKEDTTLSDPCDPCAREMAVKASTGNYLFRVEVHDVKGPASAPTEVTLKWSGENGAEQLALEKTSGTFKPLPGEYTADAWVYEFFDDVSEKHLGVHLQNGTWEPVRWPLTIDSSIPASSPELQYVRRWDGYITLQRSGSGAWSIKKETIDGDVVICGQYKGIDLSDSTADVAGKTGHVSLTGGLFSATLDELMLTMEIEAATGFIAGDYWLADVRQREVTVYLDLDASLQTGLYFLGDADGRAEPRGIEHHYLTLAEANTDGTLKPNPQADRKHAFPRLTEMT